MADVRVDIDDAAVQDMFRDWSSPVGRVMMDATQVVEDTAKIMAPVSRTGSKLAPPGYLKSMTRQSVELHHDAIGYIMGLVGAIRYPYNFTSNPTSRKGYTWNRGRQSTRPGGNLYLDESLNSLNGFVRYVE